MSIYCWNYKSQKDVPKKYANHTMQFVKDIPGGSIVSCGYCGEEFRLDDSMNNCPHCGKELVYGRCDW